MTRQKADPTYFGGHGELDAHSIVYGMRNWRVDALNRLTGMVYKESIWVPGVNRAKCMNKAKWSADIRLAYQQMTNDPHMGTWPDIPSAGFDPVLHDMDACPHGFYAYYDGSRDYHEKGDVTGVIRGTGEGVVGERGFRVMRAEIVAVKFSGSIPADKRRRVLALYNEVEEFSSIERMLKKWPLSANDLEYVPDLDSDFWTREA
jgi:hypothetical protein